MKKNFCRGIYIFVAFGRKLRQTGALNEAVFCECEARGSFQDLLYTRVDLLVSASIEGGSFTLTTYLADGKSYVKLGAGDKIKQTFFEFSANALFIVTSEVEFLSW